MAQTYTMKLDSCEGKPGIECVFHQIPENRLQKAMEMAIKAFRSVEATAEETGEIIFNFYMDSDWHLIIFNYGEMIDMLSQCFYYNGQKIYHFT